MLIVSFRKCLLADTIEDSLLTTPEFPQSCCKTSNKGTFRCKKDERYFNFVVQVLKHIIWGI